jgi:exopolysaccharide biosynthesis protein
MFGRPTTPRTRFRRILRGVLAGVGVLVLVAGVVAAWAVNRYIIDHVEIGDVAAYEAQFHASTTSSARAATSSGAATTTGSPAAGPARSPATATSSASASPSASAGGTATVIGNGSTAGGTTITITKVVTGSGNATVTSYVADVVLGSGTELRSAFAQNKFGANIIADTSDIAAANDAIFAVNGDYYGFRSSGIIIRNGVIYRDKGARRGLAIFRDGRMELYDEKATSAQELLDAGVWNTLSFGPGLLEAGEIVEGIDDVEVDTNIGNRSIQGNQPRTGLGMIGTNHFVFVAVDGRSNGYSRGVTMTQFAQMFRDLGATVAYNLDGGGSTTMVFDGEVVNNPLGKGDERGTSDILYIASARAVAS